MIIIISSGLLPKIINRSLCAVDASQSKASHSFATIWIGKQESWKHYGKSMRNSKQWLRNTNTFFNDFLGWALKWCVCSSWNSKNCSTIHLTIKFRFPKTYYIYIRSGLPSKSSSSDVFRPNTKEKHWRKKGKICAKIFWLFFWILQ